MDKKIIAAMIDHAVLKPNATDNDLEKECKIAVKYNVASVCVKPSHIKLAKDFLKNSNVLISTVIGFPHGSTTTKCKVEESIEAIENGAAELDMVINVGQLLSGNYEYVIEDIRQVAETAHTRGAIVKVIIETALLDNDSKITACRLSEQAGADFVKTSTGFNGGGAALEDIELMKNSVSYSVKLKASGGIKNFDDAVKFAEAGCTRLGTSSTIAIMEGNEEKLDNSY